MQLQFERVTTGHFVENLWENRTEKYTKHRKFALYVA